MFQQVRTQFGSLGIFVSNARPEAAAFYEAPMEITLEKWDSAVDSQAKAFLIAVREAAPLMSKGGRIVARAKQLAGSFPDRSAGMAGTRMDPDGSTGKTSGYRQCGCLALLGRGGLDHRPID